MKKTPAKIKRPLWVVGLNLALALTVGSTQAFADTPITNQTQLEAIGTDLAGSYVVTQSFSVAAAIGSTYVSGAFTGTFDGGGYTISGLTKPLFDEISSSEISNLTLIANESTGVSGRGILANYSSATINNVNTIGDVLSNNNSVGGLVGQSVGSISDSSATGDVTGGSNVGGLVGVSGGSISGSSSFGNVDGGVSVGGLVGDSSGPILNSSASGVITGNFFVGGLVGNSTSSISGSFAEGTVINNNFLTGGLVGYSEGNISNSYATGNVDGTDEVGGLVGGSAGNISNSYATGDVTGSGEYIGGLVGYSEGNISNSYATGNVDGTDEVGGLVGSTGVDTEIIDSYATGNVDGTDEVGGLVGLLGLNHLISDSYATGNVDGTYDVGGLVGSSQGTIFNSYATGDVTSSSAPWEGGDAGGLVGYSDGGITNSYASGNVDGTYDVGGLVGDLDESGSITNSYATGNVEGIGQVGGLVGYSVGYIANSYATGNVDGTDEVGGLVGYSDGGITGSYGYGEATSNGTLIEIYPDLGEGEAPNILTIVNTSLWDGFFPAFGGNASINGGRPFLISLLDSYDVVEEDTEETPSFSLRSYYTQAAKRLDKALTSFGFKSNFSSRPNLGFKALEQNQSKLPAVIQLFEVSEYQNSNILLSKDDGFQLSISSYYKEAVEIWTQGLDGEYLYLGLVEFDKDGKAILPTLKFDTASTHQLLMIKAADKLSEKPNLEAKLGQITINVF